MRRLKAVISKEFLHILRDSKSLAIIFIMPIIMMMIYGYAISFDINNINIGIVDYSNSNLSKQLIGKYRNNHYFTVINSIAAQKQADLIKKFEGWLKSGHIDAYMVIPQDFAVAGQNGKASHVSFIIDGSDANSANIIFQYCDQILNGFVNETFKMAPLLKVHTKVYFNIEVKSAFFFIPGLIAILLLMVSALLTSLSISKERERGSLSLLFISPLKSFEIILGKTIAYIVVSLLVELAILVFCRFWFGIPLRGSLILLFLFSMVYIFTGLAMGIMISTIAPDQKTAMLATLMATLLPSIMLSGFIFPIDSLVEPLQLISKIVPATYFLTIIRGIILKSAGISDLIVEASVLMLMSGIIIFIATKKFSKERNRST